MSEPESIQIDPAVAELLDRLLKKPLKWRNAETLERQIKKARGLLGHFVKKKPTPQQSEEADEQSALALKESALASARAGALGCTEAELAACFAACNRFGSPRLRLACYALCVAQCILRGSLAEPQDHGNTDGGPFPIPIPKAPDLGSGKLECDNDLQPIYESTENHTVSIELKPCPGGSIYVIAGKKIRSEPAETLTVFRPMSVTLNGAIIGIRCKGGELDHQCSYRIVQIT